MLGLRAKLPTPPPEAVTVFMKTDGRKSEPHTPPHICLTKYIPTPTHASASSIIYFRPPPSVDQ